MSMRPDPKGGTGGSEGLSTPNPDPTVLTTNQLIRENVWLREVIETRLDGMDKAIELLQATADKFPSRMDEKIQSLRSVHDEKFTSIETQFKERDVRTEQTLKDGKVSVDAALQAQKESAAKSETSTAKQIDQQGELISTNTRALDDKINDVKQRLARMESKNETTHDVAQDTQQQHNWSTGVVLSTAMGFLGTMVAIAAVILSVIKH